MIRFQILIRQSVSKGHISEKAHFGKCYLKKVSLIRQKNFKKGTFRKKATFEKRQLGKIISLVVQPSFGRYHFLGINHILHCSDL